MVLGRSSPAGRAPGQRSFVAVIVCLFVGAAAGCLKPGTVHYRFVVPEQQGLPTQVTTNAGRYDGYDVIGPCARWAWSVDHVVVRGQGPRHLTDLAKDGWSDSMVGFRARAEEALGPLAQMVWYASSGCYQRGDTLTVYVGSYDQYDATIVRVGALLRDEGLGDDVEITLLRPNDDGGNVFERTARMPLARRPFYPYEAAVTAGARYDGAWDATLAAHLGVIWGREREPPSKAGWFGGLGVDGRVTPGAQVSRWSAGPSARLGWAFGALEPDKPASSTNRGTYLYGQVGAAWSAESTVLVPSVGVTTLAVAEVALRRYNETGNGAYLLLLPLALVDHVELAAEIDPSTSARTTFAVLLGFSL